MSILGRVRGLLGLGVCRQVALFLLLASCSVRASGVLEYSGRVMVGGVPFSGEGRFVFALEDAKGVTRWQSGPLPGRDSEAVSASAVRLVVREGGYSVKLGEQPLRDLPEPGPGWQLRIWFNDGRQGWAPAGSPVPVSPTAGSSPMTAVQADVLISEIRQLRAELAAGRPAVPVAQAPMSATVRAVDRPSLGRADAPVVLVEFTDYECPFCRMFNETVLPQLIEKFVKPGQLRIVTRSIDSPVHVHAGMAARALLCADGQGKFWEMREHLMKGPEELSPEIIEKAAGEVGVNVPGMRACMDSQTARLTEDTNDFRAAGFTGTPSFVLGREKNGSVTGQVIDGAQAFEVFERAIKTASPTGP